MRLIFFVNALFFLKIIEEKLLKNEIDKNTFVDKNLKDFNKGKEIIDNLLELNKQNVDDNVKNALMIYCMYKLKGGK